MTIKITLTTKCRTIKDSITNLKVITATTNITNSLEVIPTIIIITRLEMTLIITLVKTGHTDTAEMEQ